MYGKLITSKGRQNLITRQHNERDKRFCDKIKSALEPVKCSDIRSPKQGPEQNFSQRKKLDSIEYARKEIRHIQSSAV